MTGRAPKRGPRPLDEFGESCLCGHSAADHDPETWDCCAPGSPEDCDCIIYEPDVYTAEGNGDR